ncbi:MAG: hypothetical protein V1709_05635 [Planctomycetota bacterium]
MLEFILILVVLVIFFFVFISSPPRSEEELKLQKEKLSVASKETLVTVAECIHLIDAQAVQMRLESEDIESYMADENIVLFDPLYSPAVDGVKIQVKSSDVPKALKVLNTKPEVIEEKQEEYKGTGESCPKCSSYNIYPYKYFFGWLSVISALLFGLPIPRRRMYCFSCKHKWKSSYRQTKQDKIDASYKKTILNEKALKYITTKLDDVANIKNYGNAKDSPVKFEGKILARLVLELVNLKQGTIYTMLPPNISLKQINEFENGGVIPLSDKDRANITLIGGGVMVPTPNNFNCLYSIIKEYLRGNNQNICIFIDAMANVDDKGMQEEKTDFFTFQNNIYWCITSANAEEDKIKTVMMNSSDAWIGFLGILTSTEKLETPPFNKREVTLKELGVFAKNTSRIIVSAYDGESFLIWEKSVSYY